MHFQIQFLRFTIGGWLVKIGRVDLRKVPIGAKLTAA